MNMENSALKRKTREVDVCVIGGGLAGICAAISAARTGAKVVLMSHLGKVKH